MKAFLLFALTLSSFAALAESSVRCMTLSKFPYSTHICASYGNDAAKCSTDFRCVSVKIDKVRVCKDQVSLTDNQSGFEVQLNADGTVSR